MKKENKANEIGPRAISGVLEIIIVFDDNIEKVEATTTNYNNEPYTVQWLTSGSSVDFGVRGTSAINFDSPLKFNIYFKNNAVLENVSLKETNESGGGRCELQSFDDNSFTLTGTVGDIGYSTYTVTLTSKRPGVKEVSAIKYGGKAIRNINGKPLRALIYNNKEYVIKQGITDITSLSWSQIIDAANNGKILESCVGQEKSITIGSTSYDVVLIGVNHDDLVSGGKANTTWQLKNLYNTQYRMNDRNTTSGGYASTEMHTVTLPSIFNQIQSDVRSAIKPVVKKASAGSQSSSIINTNCNLFLLSEIEIFGEIKYSASGEGTQYTYWQQHDNYDDRWKGPQSSPTDNYHWWERSPTVSDSNVFCLVGPDGSAFGTYASSSGGVSFAFCI